MKKKLQDPFISTFAIDIGGSLAKVAFLYQGFVESAKNNLDYERISKEINFIESNTNFMLKMKSGEIVDFVEFPTECIPEFLKWVKKEKILERKKGKIEKVYGCGGGIRKFKDMIEKETGCEVEAKDEIGMLVKGMNFFLGGSDYFIDSSVFIYKYDRKEYIKPMDENAMKDFFPYMFVHIGSGISIVKVESKTKYRRVTGSPIGGATFVGLLKLFLQRDDIDISNIFENITKGDYRKVDLLVGDIYGFGNKTTSNLNSNLVAACFGKIATKKISVKDSEQTDLAASLIYMIGINISQIVCLAAKLHNVNNIVFSGGFMRKNQKVWSLLSTAVEYWTGELRTKFKPHFLKHDKFSGCLGCLLGEDL